MKKWEPLSLFPKWLSLTQPRCSTFSWELLDIYLAIKHSRYTLEQNSFIVYTDYKTFTKALDNKYDYYSQRSGI